MSRRILPRDPATAIIEMARLFVVSDAWERWATGETDREKQVGWDQMTPAEHVLANQIANIIEGVAVGARMGLKA